MLAFVLLWSRRCCFLCSVVHLTRVYHRNGCQLPLITSQADTASRGRRATKVELITTNPILCICPFLSVSRGARHSQEEKMLSYSVRTRRGNVKDIFDLSSILEMLSREIPRETANLAFSYLEERFWNCRVCLCIC